MTAATFRGPLFIVGLPRSGTKLLRALVTNSPRIFAPPAETNFLPYWHRHWDRFGDLSDKDQFRSFYARVTGAPYFVYMRDAGQLIDCDKWFVACQGYSTAGIFEALVRHDSGCGSNARAIWCDKSPSYLTQVPLLASMFPEARFLHIVRDVRDYCLSISRAWGKNMLRAAQRWNDSVHAFRESVADTGVRHHELRYEDLLQEPQRELSSICDFLGVPFESEMLSLAHSPENLGDTRGQTSIISANQNKYAGRLDRSLRETIEQLAKTGLDAYGYPCPAVSSVRLAPWQLGAYQIADGINLLRFEIRERGVPAALNFRWRAFLESGIRGD